MDAAKGLHSALCEEGLEVEVRDALERYCYETRYERILGTA